MKKTDNGISSFQLTLLVSLLAMIGPFSIDTYLPSFPSLENEFSVSRALMTQTIGAYIIAFATSTLIWGAITDWLGRKPVILVALGAYLLASMACALATSYEQFLGFRILQGVGIGGALIAGRAMVRDLLPTKEAQKLMAKSMMVFASAPAIAPIVGGFLHESFGWRAVFWFLMTYATLIFIFTALKVKESLPLDKRNSIHISKVSRVYLATLKNPHYVRLVLINALAFASFFIYIAGAPTLVFDILKLQADQFYVFFVPMVLGIFMGAFASNKLINHYSNQQMMHAFLSAMLGLAILNLIISSFFETTALRTVTLLVLYSFSLATIMPILGITIINCFPNNRGAASAMQSFVQMGFNGFSASIIVVAIGASLINFTYAQLILVSLAMILWWFDNRKPQ